MFAGRAGEADSVSTVRETPLYDRARKQDRNGGTLAPGRARGYSSTSSMRVPNAVFGWTNATVVPRLPGRGVASITW